MIENQMEIFSFLRLLELHRAYKITFGNLKYLKPKIRWTACPISNPESGLRGLGLTDQRCRFIKFADLVKADGIFGLMLWDRL